MTDSQNVEDRVKKKLYAFVVVDVIFIGYVTHIDNNSFVYAASDKWCFEISSHTNCVYEVDKDEKNMSQQSKPRDYKCFIVRKSIFICLKQKIKEYRKKLLNKICVFNTLLNIIRTK